MHLWPTASQADIHHGRACHAQDFCLQRLHTDGCRSKRDTVPGQRHSLRIFRLTPNR